MNSRSFADMGQNTPLSLLDQKARYGGLNLTKLREEIEQ